MVCPTAAHAQPGTPLWTNRSKGVLNGADYAQATAVDGGGNIYVTGYSQGGVSYYATLAYSSDEGAVVDQLLPQGAISRSICLTPVTRLSR